MMTRKRRNIQKKKYSCSRENCDPCNQPESSETIVKTEMVERLRNSDGRNTALPVQDGVTEPPEDGDEDKIDFDDSDKRNQEIFTPKTQQSASDCKKDSAEGKFFFQRSFRQTPSEVIIVTVEHSQLDLEIIGSDKITSQYHLPSVKTRIDSGRQVDTAVLKYSLSSLEVEIKQFSFSDSPDVGATFVITHKGNAKRMNPSDTFTENESSQCQRHESQSAPSTAITNGNHTNSNNGRDINEGHSWLNLTITTNETHMKVTDENDFNCGNETTVCEQNCDESFKYRKESSIGDICHSTVNPATEEFSHSYILSGFSSYSEDREITNCFPHIPPPGEFADDPETTNHLVKTQVTAASLQPDQDNKCETSSMISLSSNRHLLSAQKGTVKDAADHLRTQSFLTGSKQEHASILTCLSECDLSGHLVAREKTGLMETIANTKRIIFRNNSVGDPKSKIKQSRCLELQAIRRKTYPDVLKPASKISHNEIQNAQCMLYGDQPSTVNPQPFCIQTLPWKQGTNEPLWIEEIPNFIYFKEYNTPDRRNYNNSYNGSGISRWSSSTTLSAVKSPCASSTLLGEDNPRLFEFKSEESIDDVFYLSPTFRQPEDCKGHRDIFEMECGTQQNNFPEQRIETNLNEDIFLWQSTEPQEIGELTESGFDEETLDSDHPSELAEDVILTNEQFQIQIIPPSPSSSNDQTCDKSQALNTVSENVFDCGCRGEGSVKTEKGDNNTESKKRRNSVTIILTQGCLDQRIIVQHDNRVNGSSDAPKSFSDLAECNEKSKSVCESDTVEYCDPELDTIAPQTASSNHALSQSFLTSISDDLEQSNENIEATICEEDEEKCLTPSHSEIIVANPPVKRKSEQNNKIKCSGDQKSSIQSLVEGKQTLEKDTVAENSPLPVTSVTVTYQKEDTEEPNHKIESEEEMDRNSQKIEVSTKQNLHKDLNTEVSCHLRLPADPVLKDGKNNENSQEASSTREGSDYWAKRRRMFKESKEWNSGGRSSITSNMTEESVNSEETRSVDMIQARIEIEQRGFYTETYNSASWIYRGDEGNPNTSSTCLSKRPRPVAIRERTVKIAKGTGDYPWGFRIQFSKPILVTEVDTNGAADEASLHVGDIVTAVNGTDVTSIPHSEAATLARQGPDILTLVVESDISRCPNTPRPAYRGYLYKRTQSGLLKGWRKRWFVLKHDGYLYYYKNKKDEGKYKPLDIIKLEGAEVEVDTSLGKPFVFKCKPQSRHRMFYFSAISNQEMKRWLEAMEQAVHPVHQNHVWVDVSYHNASLPPLAIKNPECLGLLRQMDQNKDVWVQHYCVLKDACIYFYTGIRSTCALGGIYLHGYSVTEQTLGSKRSVIEAKPPSEEFKTFYLCADNGADNNRWIVALKTSISKWLPLHQAIHNFMNSPLEETRM